jgi:molybdate transport system substrate-binding protein
MRTQFGALAFAMAAGITVLPHAAVAAEIKIMCPAPMRTAIVDLAARFERKTPHKITFIHLPSSFIVDRVKGGEAVDVTILTARASDDLIKEGKLARRVDIARSSIGLAVRAGAPKPDVSSADAFKRTLLAVKSFARNEGAESGVHMLRVFDRLGITEQMEAKAMPVNTGYVAELVVRGEAEMAAQQMPELIAVPGVKVTSLPPEFQLIIVFSAGVSAGSTEPGAVNALLNFLTSQEAAAVLTAKGLNPA